MIQTLKRKFIVTAMIAVTVLLALLLGAVNAVNAWSTGQEAKRLLESLVSMETQAWPELPGGENPPLTPPQGEPPFQWEEGGPRGFMLEPFNENDQLSAVYFAVWLREGEAVRTDVSRIGTVTEDEAAALARSAWEAGETEGREGSYRFASGLTVGGERVYVFLENAARQNAVLRVAALSALAGLGGWLLMLALVVLLSRKTIAPIAENMDRQRQFVTDAGHELKTPLAIIQANTEALELLSGETKWSRNIKAQTLRLTELTRDLLTLARAEELPAQGSFAPVDLSALAQKTAQMFQASMERRGLRLESDLETGVTVRGSEAQLANLCSILLDNAVKYAAQDTALALRLRAGEKTCTLRVENVCQTRPDCPPERLFDRFYRADAARSQSTGGFGIGLSAARVIARRHRGRLEAEYPAEDRIAFTVTLPKA